MTEALISLTPAAIARARDLLAKQGAGAVGIRLAVRTTGCSGLSYMLDFARDKRPEDQIVEKDGVTILVEGKVAELVSGTEVDFVEDKLGAQFIFRNPHERGRCGCGESFSV